MNFPPDTICLKDPNAFYIPIENTTPPIGYCLCPENTGIFDYNKDNTGTMKCTTETLYDGYKFAEYTSNASLVQRNFKYANGCATGYKQTALPSYSNYLKCTAEACPPNWKMVGSSNCERTITGKKQVIALSTLGYIAIPPNTPNYSLPKEKPKIEPVIEKNYDQLWKILKYVGWIILLLVSVLLIMFVLSKLFSSSSSTETNSVETNDNSLDVEPVIATPQPTNVQIQEPSPAIVNNSQQQFNQEIKGGKLRVRRK